MAEAGYGNTLATLELIRSFDKEQDYIILGKMIGQLNSIANVWYREQGPIPGKLNEMKRALTSPKIETLGWTYESGEDHLVSMKRTLVISTAGKAGDQRLPFHC